MTRSNVCPKVKIADRLFHLINKKPSHEIRPTRPVAAPKNSDQPLAQRFCNHIDLRVDVKFGIDILEVGVNRV